jgi:hypothetical protein
MWADGTSNPLPQLGQFAAFADFTMNVWCCNCSVCKLKLNKGKLAGGMKKRVK